MHLCLNKYASIDASVLYKDACLVEPHILISSACHQILTWTVLNKDMFLRMGIKISHVSCHFHL